MKTRRWDLDRPDLIREWSHRNGDLSSYSIRDKAIWKCDRGHEWESEIGHRLYRGQGCPFCAGQRATEETSLAFRLPDVAKRWHPSRNGQLTPKNTCFRSGKRIWWKCEKGHEWKSSVSSVKGCPYCSGRLPTLTENLAVIFPTLATEWGIKNKLTPFEFRPQSNKKAWWECSKCGNEWEAVISSRSGAGGGCPVCSKMLRGISVMDVTPELAKDWSNRNGVCNLNVIAPHSSKRVWWKCHVCGYEWKGSVANRSQGRGCLRCAFANEHYNITLNKEVIKDWDWDKNSEDPKRVSPWSARVFWWKCIRGHEWQSSVDSRARSRGCPFCHGMCSALELRVYAEMKSVFPDAKLRDRSNKVECDVWIPSRRAAVEVDGSYWHRNAQYKDRKKNEHLKRMGVNIIRLREFPLDKISDKDVVFTMDGLKDAITTVICTIDYSIGEDYRGETGFSNDGLFMELIKKGKVTVGLDVTHPDLAGEWDEENLPLLPSDVSSGSSLKVWWRCKMGHRWRVSPNSRSRGDGCPYCSGLRSTADKNFAVSSPELAKEWGDKNIERPEQVTPRSGRKFWWKCGMCKGEWQSTPKERVYGYGRCPSCFPKGKKELGRRTGRGIVGIHQTDEKRKESLRRWTLKKVIKNRSRSDSELPLDTDEKVCYTCKTLKTLKCFYKNRCTNDGRQAECVECRKEGLRNKSKIHKSLVYDKM